MCVIVCKHLLRIAALSEPWCRGGKGLPDFPNVSVSGFDSLAAVPTLLALDAREFQVLSWGVGVERWWLLTPTLTVQLFSSSLKCSLNSAVLLPEFQVMSFI